MHKLIIYPRGTSRFLVIFLALLLILSIFLFFFGFFGVGYKPLVIILVLCIGFFYSLTYFLSNYIEFDGSVLRTRYYGYPYKLLDYFIFPVFSNEYSVFRLKCISLNALRYVPKRVFLTDVNSLKAGLFLDSTVWEGNLCRFEYATFLFEDGSSKHVYTGLFCRNELLRLYKKLAHLGVVVVC